MTMTTRACERYGPEQHDNLNFILDMIDMINITKKFPVVLPVYPN